MGVKYGEGESERKKLDGNLEFRSAPLYFRSCWQPIRWAARRKELKKNYVRTGKRAAALIKKENGSHQTQIDSLDASSVVVIVVFKLALSLLHKPMVMDKEFRFLPCSLKIY